MKTIFEIKKQMKLKGWSVIFPEDLEALPYFTKQWVLDTLAKHDDMEGYDPNVCDIVLGCDTIFWENVEEEW